MDIKETYRKIDISLELDRNKIGYGDWAQGGFGRLVLNDHIDIEESERRMLNYLGNEELSFLHSLLYIIPSCG